MGKVIKYTEGELINGLEFIKETEITRKKRRAQFRCFCGNEFETEIGYVKVGDVKSCGCLKKISPNKTHGRSKTPEWYAYLSMKTRCYNTNNGQYHNYGGRGITVCPRWLESFENFFEDMGLKPTPQHSLDRKDVNGNYEPLNCRWATKLEQANNKRNNSLYTYDEKTKSLADWCRELNMDYDMVNARLLIGWTFEECIYTPKGFSKGKIVMDTNTGIFFDSCAEASRCYGKSESNLMRMLTGKRHNKTNLKFV